MRAYHLAAFAAVGLLVAACANVEKVGTSSYPPLSPGSDVVVFTDESQVKQPFEVVAKITYSDPGKFQMLSLADAFEPLKVKARAVGANGVIIDHSETVISGIISRGISVEARGIRLLPTPAQAAPQPTPAAATAAPTAPQGSVKNAADELRELRKLHDDGVLTDQEYQSKKAEILRRM